MTTRRNHLTVESMYGLGIARFLAIALIGVKRLRDVSQQLLGLGMRLRQPLSCHNACRVQRSCDIFIVVRKVCDTQKRVYTVRTLNRRIFEKGQDVYSIISINSTTTPSISTHHSSMYFTPYQNVCQTSRHPTSFYSIVSTFMDRRWNITSPRLDGGECISPSWYIMV